MLVRLASLSVATFVLIVAPLLLMYVGGLLADLPFGRETGRFLGGGRRGGPARDLPRRPGGRWSRR